MSADEDELLDLLSRTRLSSDDLIALYARCMRRHTMGLLTLEQFARECEEQVVQARQRRRDDRHTRKQQQEQQQRGVKEVGEQQPPSAVPPSGEEAIGSYWDEQEEAEEKDMAELLSGEVTDEQRLKQLRESAKRASFIWWELLALYRTAQPVTGGYHDIRELMVGVAQLAYDHESWQAVKQRMLQQQGASASEEADRKLSALSRSRRLQMCYQPWKKLEVAWRVSQPPGAGDTMTYEEVGRMVARMMRSGHFTAASLARGVSHSLLQPHYVQMDAEAVTYLIFQQLHRDSRWRTQQPGRADIERDVFITKDAAIAAAPPPPPPVPSFEERLTVEPAPHSAAFMRHFVPLAPSTALEPAYHASTTATPVIPASSSLTYSQLLAVCRSLSVRGRVQLWYGVARDTKSGERAGPIKRRRMALQETLLHSASGLQLIDDMQSAAHWLP